jgi:hypothetical protein
MTLYKCFAESAAARRSKTYLKVLLNRNYLSVCSYILILIFNVMCELRNHRAETQERWELRYKSGLDFKSASTASSQDEASRKRVAETGTGTGGGSRIWE